MSLIKVVIDRKRWLRGEGADLSFLLRPADDKMCCLGFACLASGLNNGDIHGCTDPHNLEVSVQDKIPGAMTAIPIVDETGEDAPVNCAMEINDNKSIDGETRERLLKEIAPQLGYEFHFVN